MALAKYREWSKSTICRPKDNLLTEGLKRARRFVMVSSLETDCQPVSMHLLLGNEYGRIWLKDRDEFRAKTFGIKTKIIHNDYDWWVKLRKTDKCFCVI